MDDVDKLAKEYELSEAEQNFLKATRQEERTAGLAQRNALAQLISAKNTANLSRVIEEFSDSTSNLTGEANRLLRWYVGTTIVIAILTAVGIWIK